MSLAFLKKVVERGPQVHGCQENGNADQDDQQFMLR